MPQPHRGSEDRQRRIQGAGARRIQVGARPVRDPRLRSADLLQRLRQLECEVCCIEDKLDDSLIRRQQQILEISRRVARLSAEVATGQPANPALQTLFNSSIGTTVTVTVASGALTGTVTAVGTNAVELTETDGDILIIPYSRITGIE